MSQELDAVVEQLKAIGIKHGKEIMLECVAVVFPLALKAVAAAIPGPIDDGIIAATEPMMEAALKELIEKIKA